ncbi:hypothetical protein [Thioalkalivibrio sp. ALE16]|uniref:hypothetical protein n=1 Tax=Thioalkalivibrio sp. ALE16 TaxID=1158172 RepID=UPI000381E5D5|nr:hypothetical protein [Thioalkalivibrio sp. ALE16]
MKDKRWTATVPRLGTLYDLRESQNVTLVREELARRQREIGDETFSPWILIFGRGTTWVDTKSGSGEEIDRFLRCGNGANANPGDARRPKMAVELAGAIHEKTHKVPKNVASGPAHFSTALRYGEIFIDPEDANPEEGLVWTGWPSDRVIEYAPKGPRSFRGSFKAAVQYMVRTGWVAESNGYGIPDHDPEDHSRRIRNMLALEIVLRGVEILGERDLEKLWIQNHPEALAYAPI